MVMIIPPKYKVSEVVSRIKAQTASKLKKTDGTKGIFKFLKGGCRKI